MEQGFSSEESRRWLEPQFTWDVIGGQMNATKEKIRGLLEKLPEDCTMEDVQYHLYVLEKIQRGISRAESEGVLTQEEAEKRLSKWTAE
jgi:hypothetical protein